MRSRPSLTGRTGSESVDPTANVVFILSWFLVTAVGLMPLGEASLHRSPSITLPTISAFLIAVGSGITLRRRYSWVGVVLHIYGQIAIWLSMFVMSLAEVLALVGS